LNCHPGEGRDPFFNSFAGGSMDPGLRRDDTFFSDWASLKAF